MKQKILLTLILLVMESNAISGQIDNELLKHLQPGRRVMTVGATSLQVGRQKLKVEKPKIIQADKTIFLDNDTLDSKVIIPVYIDKNKMKQAPVQVIKPTLKDNKRKILSNSDFDKLVFSDIPMIIKSESQQINKKSTVQSVDDTKFKKDSPERSVNNTSILPLNENKGRKNIVVTSNNNIFNTKNKSIDFVRNTVYQALKYSPEIRNAQAFFSAAKYDVDEVKGKRWPQVKIGANSPISNFGNGTTNSSDISDTSGSILMTTTIYDFGKTSSGIQSAEETFKSSVQTIQLTRNQIAYQTIEAILELNKFQKNIKVAKSYEKRMSDLVNMLSQITKTDKGRGSELVQAQSKLLQAKTNLQQLEGRWRETQIKMTRLLGKEIRLPENFEWNSVIMSSNDILNSLDSHPQILRAKAEIKASQHKVDAIRSSSYPSINWVVSKSSARDTNGDEQAWYTGVNLEWDLFSGGSDTASELAAVQRAQASQMQFETTVLELKYKIRSLFQLRDSAFERAKEYEMLSSETDRVRNMFYEQWYYLGKRSLVDVLTTESDHFNNQVSVINNQFEGYISNINVMSESATLLGWLNIPLK
ncbi:TolC family protein [Limnobaculum sp. M2-1]|nr:TolC family protein [Limnobaculum sp. M2-1]